MKRVILLCLVIVAAFWKTGATAQESGPGVVLFNNFVSTVVEAPVKRPDGSGAGAGVTAQLVWITPDGELQPLQPTTTFRTNSVETSYFVEPKVVFVKSVQPQEQVTLRMRAWLGPDFESAVLRGESNDFSISFGDFPGLEPPENLVGLEGFTLLPQVVLAAPRKEQNEFDFEVKTGRGHVVVQVSDDLLHWEVLSDVTLSGAPVTVSDQIDRPQRFYRALAE